MKRPTLLPIALALATFLLLTLALWPQDTPTATVVVASHDLGAGARLTPADLATVTLPAAQAPTDALADPDALVGQSLAVVRYAGEPITPKHLGPTLVLAPDERGIALTVQADTGLAGLLRPGMTVGLVATLQDPTAHRLFAKHLLENLRVLYVSPDFQARPAQPLDPAATPVPTAPAAPRLARQGVIVLAARTQPEPLVFESAQTILHRQLASEEAADSQTAPEPAPAPPDVRWAVPVELLAALNAADAAFTLVLSPADAQPFTSPGLELPTLLTQSAQE